MLSLNFRGGYMHKKYLTFLRKVHIILVDNALLLFLLSILALVIVKQIY